MDQLDYNAQAKDWQTLKQGDIVSSLTYRVPHVDVLTYETEAMDASDPWYLHDSPYGGPIVPPGYFYGEYLRLLTAVNFPMGALNAKLSFQSKGHILHGEQVTVVGIVDKFYEKRERPYMDLEVIVKNEKNEEVVKGLVTLLLKI